MSQFPRELTIPGPGGMPVGAVASPCKRIYTTNDAAPCCGGAGCGCLAPCGTFNGFTLGEGRYVQVGQVGEIVVDTLVPGQCCCRNAPGRIYTREERRCLDGPCAGALNLLREVWFETDGVTATRRTRDLFGGGDCCGPMVEFNETVPLSPANWCTPVMGFGTGQPGIGGSGAGSFSNSGWFSTTCSTMEAFRVSRTVPPGSSSPGYEIRTHTRGYFSRDECHSVECLRACCLPGERCRDDLTIAQCLARGGIPNPGEDCYNAHCDRPNPGWGACCNPATGGCAHTRLPSCLPPNVFLGLGTTCQGGARPTCPEPVGRCCVPGGGGGYTCTGNTTPTQCAALNGIWGGWQSTCAGSPCPPPAGGACCRGDGTCNQVNSPQECVNLGGVFMGAGSDCATTPCVTACCHDNRCDPLPIGQCALIGGTSTQQGGCDPDPCNVGACCCGSQGNYACSQTTQLGCIGPLTPPNCFWFGPGVPCSPNPCNFFGLQFPNHPNAFARGLVNPDGTPANVRPSSRIIVPGGGCNGCGSAEATSRF